MDESDSDQILTIEELRSLRDRMRADAAPPRATASAAEAEGPRPPTAIPVQPRADPWEDLRRRASERRRWARPLAAAGCLALAGGAITALVMTANTRSVPPSAPETSPHAVPVPAVSAPPVAVSASGTVLPTPDPSVLAPIPILPTVSQSAGTTEPRAAVVPAPQATSRRKPPPPATSTAARPLPADRQPPAAPAEQAGTAPTAPAKSCGAGCTQPTLTRTPTSWSPVAPP